MVRPRLVSARGNVFWIEQVDYDAVTRIKYMERCMNNGNNATHLTDRYLGQECSLWTPCIYDFLGAYHPELPTYSCIESPSRNGPWYKREKELLQTGGSIVCEKGFDDLLSIIGDAFGLPLVEDQSRFTENGNIAGIVPDMVVIQQHRQGVALIENKPYYHSTFDGNQAPPDGAYLRYVEWLCDKGIPTTLVVIHSSSWKEYPLVKQLSTSMKDKYRSVMLEDVFLLMEQSGFRYSGITECWGDFTNKYPDCNS